MHLWCHNWKAEDYTVKFLRIYCRKQTRTKASYNHIMKIWNRLVLQKYLKGHNAGSEQGHRVCSLGKCVDDIKHMPGVKKPIPKVYARVMKSESQNSSSHQLLLMTSSVSRREYMISYHSIDILLSQYHEQLYIISYLRWTTQFHQVERDRKSSDNAWTCSLVGTCNDIKLPSSTWKTAV